MAKKDDDIKLDLDDDYDDFMKEFGSEFGDFDDSDPDIKKDRKPISDIASGLKSSFNPKEHGIGFIGKLIKDVLPGSYGDAYSSIMSFKYDAESMFDDARKELAPALNVIDKKVQKALPTLGKFLPNKVTNKIKDMSHVGKESDSYDYGRSSNTRETGLKDTLETIFGAQQLEGKLKRKRDDVIQLNSIKLDKAKFQHGIEYQHKIVSGIGRIVGFQDKILATYYKKSLEVQYLHYFATQDILENTLSHNSKTLTLLADVVKNTALPNEVKVTNSEKFRDESKRRIIGSVQKSISNRLGDMPNRIKNNLKTQISEFASAINSNLPQEDGMDEFMPSAAEMAAGMAGDEAREGLGKLFAGWIKKNGKKHVENVLGERGTSAINKTNAVGQDLARWFGDLPGIINRKVKHAEYGSLVGSVGELFNGGDNGTLGESVNKNLMSDATETVSWDLISRRSLIEIIPGYLSRILEQQTKLYNYTSGNGEIAERLTFDTRTEQFTTLSSAKKRVSELLKKEVGVDLKTNADYIIDLIDPDKNILNANERKYLGIFFMKQSAVEGVNFDPIDYASPDNLPAVLSYESRNKIANLFIEKFKITEEFNENGIKTVSSNDIETATLKKDISRNYNALRYGVGNFGDVLNEANATGTKELLGNLINNEGAVNQQYRWDLIDALYGDQNKSPKARMKVMAGKTIHPTPLSSNNSLLPTSSTVNINEGISPTTNVNFSNDNITTLVNVMSFNHSDMLKALAAHSSSNNALLQNMIDLMPSAGFINYTSTPSELSKHLNSVYSAGSKRIKGLSTYIQDTKGKLTAIPLSQNIENVKSGLLKHVAPHITEASKQSKAFYNKHKHLIPAQLQPEEIGKQLTAQSGKLFTELEKRGFNKKEIEDLLKTKLEEANKVIHTPFDAKALQTNLLERKDKLVNTATTAIRGFYDKHKDQLPDKPTVENLETLIKEKNPKLFENLTSKGLTPNQINAALTHAFDNRETTFNNLKEKYGSVNKVKELIKNKAKKVKGSDIKENIKNRWSTGVNALKTNATELYDKYGNKIELPKLNLPKWNNDDNQKHNGLFNSSNPDELTSLSKQLKDQHKDLMTVLTETGTSTNTLLQTIIATIPSAGYAAPSPDGDPSIRKNLGIKFGNSFKRLSGISRFIVDKGGALIKIPWTLAKLPFSLAMAAYNPLKTMLGFTGRTLWKGGGFLKRQLMKAPERAQRLAKVGWTVAKVLGPLAAKLGIGSAKLALLPAKLLGNLIWWSAKKAPKRAARAVGTLGKLSWGAFTGTTQVMSNLLFAAMGKRKPDKKDASNWFSKLGGVLKNPVGSISSFFKNRKKTKSVDENVNEISNKLDTINTTLKDIKNYISTKWPTENSEEKEANREGGFQDIIKKRKAKQETAKKLREMGVPTNKKPAPIVTPTGGSILDAFGKAGDLVKDAKGWGGKALGALGIGGAGAAGVAGAGALAGGEAAATAAGAATAAAEGGAGLATVGELGVAGAALGESALLLSNPVGWAIIVGAAGYGLYKGTKYIMNRTALEPLEKLRFLQYGIPIDNSQAVADMRNFESDFTPHITLTKNIPKIDLLPKEVWEKYYKDFGCTYDNMTDKTNFNTWLYKRFLPVYIKHKASLQQFGKSKVDNIDDELKKEDIIKFVNLVQFGSVEANLGMNPYGIQNSPWHDITLSDNKSTIDVLVEQLRNQANRNNDTKADNLKKVSAINLHPTVTKLDKDKPVLPPNYDRDRQQGVNPDGTPKKSMFDQAVDWSKENLLNPIKDFAGKVGDKAKELYTLGKTAAGKGIDWAKVNLVEPVVNSLAGLIKNAESGSKGYNAYNRGTSGNKILGPVGNRDLTSMTLSEILADMNRSANDERRLFAVGKYQMIPPTLIDGIKKLGLNPDTTKFDAKTQELLFSKYLLDKKRPQISAYIKGKTDNPVAAANAAAEEWASLADPNTGRSKHGHGNVASVSAERVITAMNVSRAQYKANLSKGMSEDEAYQVAVSSSSNAIANTNVPINTGGLPPADAFATKGNGPSLASNDMPPMPTSSVMPTPATSVTPANAVTSPIAAASKSTTTSTANDMPPVPSATTLSSVTTQTALNTKPIEDKLVQANKDSANRHDEHLTKLSTTNDLLAQILTTMKSTANTPAQNIIVANASSAKQTLSPVISSGRTY